MIKKINVDVFKSASFGDCTNGGLTSRKRSMFLFVDCTREEAVEECEKFGINPEDQLLLVRRELWGERHDYAEPLVKPERMAQCFGGNFVYTSDSRFHEWTGCWNPMPVHDRFDTWEDFNALSV